MMRRQHTGRARTAVVPADWAAAPAAIVARTLPSTIKIVRTSDPAWDEGRGRTAATSATVYTGPASIMAATDGRPAVTADDDTTTRTYDITLALSRPGADQAAAGDVVTVQACDDVALVGRRLHVVDAERGSRRFSRVLAATLLD